jgi:hypothetical protein
MQFMLSPSCPNVEMQQEASSLGPGGSWPSSEPDHTGTCSHTSILQNFLLFMSHPIYGDLFQQSELTKTGFHEVCFEKQKRLNSFAIGYFSVIIKII